MNDSSSIASSDYEYLRDVEQPSLTSLEDQSEGSEGTMTEVFKDTEEYEPYVSDNGSCFSDESPVCSTPKKTFERCSVSLIDVSNIEPYLVTKPRSAGSTETLLSRSSLGKSKDSGYVRSGSSLSLSSCNKTYDHVESTVKKYIRDMKANYSPRKNLKEDTQDQDPSPWRAEQLLNKKLIRELDFKNIMISALQESNTKLRTKLAEAENKIHELRFKCEQHCTCCHSKKSGSSGGSSGKGKTLGDSFDQIFVPRASLIPRSESVRTLETMDNVPVVKDEHILYSTWSPRRESEEVAVDSLAIVVPNDQLQDKLKRWQESMGQTPISPRVPAVAQEPTLTKERVVKYENRASQADLACCYPSLGSCTRARPRVAFQRYGDQSVKVAPVKAHHGSQYLPAPKTQQVTYFHQLPTPYQSPCQRPIEEKFDRTTVAHEQQLAKSCRLTLPFKIQVDDKHSTQSGLGCFWFGKKSPSSTTSLQHPPASPPSAYTPQSAYPPQPAYPPSVSSTNLYDCLYQVDQYASQLSTGLDQLARLRHTTSAVI